MINRTFEVALMHQLSITYDQIKEAEQLNPNNNRCCISFRYKGLRFVLTVEEIGGVMYCDLCKDDKLIDFERVNDPKDLMYWLNNLIIK